MNAVILNVRPLPYGLQKYTPVDEHAGSRMELSRYFETRATDFIGSVRGRFMVEDIKVVIIAKETMTDKVQIAIRKLKEYTDEIEFICIFSDNSYMKI